MEFTPQVIEDLALAFNQHDVFAVWLEIIQGKLNEYSAVMV